MVEPLFFFFGGGASRPFDIPTKKEMVTQFRKEMSESKSQGIDEEVRPYDVIASSALPGPSFLSAYPIRYDDCTDQLLDTDPLLLRDTVEFGVDLLAECLHVLGLRHLR